MDWKRWIEDGLARPAPDAKERAVPRCKDAWDLVVEAREAYLAHDWERTDDQLRNAMKTATEALFYYNEYEPTAPDSYELARRVCRETFGERMTGGIFERAGALRELLPLEEELDEDTSHTVRRSVAASSELVALIECFVFI